MAPAKKLGKGVPPIPVKVRTPVVEKKLTRKEQHELKAAAWRKEQTKVHQSVKALRAERIADWDLKSEQLQGKDDPDLPTDRGTKHGRPSVLYTDELDEVLFELLCIGTSLDTISTLKGTPGLSTMLRWLAKEEHPFSITYARARSMVVPLYEDRALAAVLNPLTGKVHTKRQVLDRDGKVVEVEETRESDNVARSALVLSGYQWALGWMVPKKHGKQAQPSDDSNDALKQLLGQFQQRSKEIEDEA
jgi:hypothetical protein